MWVSAERFDLSEADEPLWNSIAGHQDRLDPGREVCLKAHLEAGLAEPASNSACNPVASLGKASPRVQAHIDADGNRLPYSVHYSHISVSALVHLESSKLIEPSVVCFRGHPRCDRHDWSAGGTETVGTHAEGP